MTPRERDRNRRWLLFVGHLSTRARSAIKLLGASSFDELASHRALELARLRNVGRKTIAEIELAMRRRGYAFRGEGCPSCGKPLPRYLWTAFLQDEARRRGDLR